MTATASIWSASLAPLMLRMTAARASVSARLTPASVSLASAASSAGSAAASRDRNTACAASKRFAGSGASKVNDPSAASIARRSRLLIRTSFKSEAFSPATACPVAASRKVPDSVLTKTFLAPGLKNSRPSWSAPITIAARGLPLAAIASMAFSVSL